MFGKQIRRLESDGQAVEYGPLVAFPTWDGKLVLAAIFICGYYGLIFALVLGTTNLSDNKAGMVRDAMLTLGPPIGLIFGALFRTTGAEERREAQRSVEMQTAITTPGAPAGGKDLESAVQDGAEDGTKAGITKGLAAAGANSPLPDRVDHGRFPIIDEMLASRPDPTDASYRGPDLPNTIPLDAPEDAPWAN